MANIKIPTTEILSILDITIDIVPRFGSMTT